MSDTPYCTFAQYKLRQNADGVDQAQIEAELLAASRTLDSNLCAAPGHLAPIDGVTYQFAGSGRRILQLADGNLGFGLRSITEITADYSAQGGQLETWTLADGIVAHPRNAVALGRVWRWLELRLTDGPRAWPAGGDVEVTGDWGYASIPPGATELVAWLARVYIDTQTGGAAAVVAAFDDGFSVGVSPMASRLWRNVERTFTFDAAVRR